MEVTDRPIALKPPIKFWSASAIKKFESCPFELWLKRVLKIAPPVIEDEANHPLIRGTRIHEEAEMYVRGEAPLSRDLRKVEEPLTKLKEQFAAGIVECEQDWWFDRAWQPTEPFQGWGIVKCDAVVRYPNRTAEVWDYKTGKSYGKEVTHTQQMSAYAIAAFARYPDLMVLETVLLYTDEGKEKRKKYLRPQVDVLRTRFEARANKLTNAVAFPPKPNRVNCRYCAYSPNRGVGNGECPYGIEV